MNRSLLPWRRGKGEVAARKEEENPFLSLHQRMDDLFEDFFQDFEGAFRNTGLSLAGSRGWQAAPRVDVAETDDEVQITADLPGMAEKDVEVTLDNDLLTIKGTRQHEREEKKRDYHLMERSYGEFQRVIPVPAGVDKEKAKASFKNGVLTLNLPKLPEARTQKRKIEITSG